MGRVRGVGREAVSRTSSIPRSGGRPKAKRPARVGEGSHQKSATLAVRDAKAGWSCPSKAIGASTKRSDATWSCVPPPHSEGGTVREAREQGGGGEAGAALSPAQLALAIGRGELRRPQRVPRFRHATMAAKGCGRE